jgi:hypothetical protein
MTLNMANRVRIKKDGPKRCRYSELNCYHCFFGVNRKEEDLICIREPANDKTNEHDGLTCAVTSYRIGNETEMITNCYLHKDDFEPYTTSMLEFLGLK